jgi:hypothetical protein
MVWILIVDIQCDTSLIVIHLIERMHHTYILSKYLLNAAYVMAGLLMMYEKKGGDWHHSKYSVLTPDVMTMFTTTTVPSPSMHSVQRKDIECCNFFLYFIFLCVLCWVSWKVPHGNTKDNVDNCCGDLVGMQKWWYRQKVTGGRAQTLQVTTHIAVVFQCPI